MDRVLRDKKTIAIFVLPALIVFIVIVIIPIFASGYYSTLEWSGGDVSKFIGLDNYKEIFQDEVFTKSIINSLILAALSVFVQLPIALIFALILASGIKGEGFFRTIYFIPVVLTTVVIAQLWTKIYHPTYGVINHILRSIGLESWAVGWLGDKNWALIAVFIPIIWQWVGYHILLLYSAIKGIPDEIHEAAKIDGASPIRIAWNIIIPLIKPMLKACTTIALIGSLKVFDMIYVLTNGGPANATEVPSTLMYSSIFKSDRYGLGSSMAVFIVIECLILTVIIQKLVKSEEVTY